MSNPIRVRSIGNDSSCNVIVTCTDGTRRILTFTQDGDVSVRLCPEAKSLDRQKEQPSTNKANTQQKQSSPITPGQQRTTALNDQDKVVTPTELRRNKNDERGKVITQDSEVKTAEGSEHRTDHDTSEASNVRRRLSFSDDFTPQSTAKNPDVKETPQYFSETSASPAPQSYRRGSIRRSPPAKRRTVSESSRNDVSRPKGQHHLEGQSMATNTSVPSSTPPPKTQQEGLEQNVIPSLSSPKTDTSNLPVRRPQQALPTSNTPQHQRNTSASLCTCRCCSQCCPCVCQCCAQSVARSLSLPVDDIDPQTLAALVSRRGDSGRIRIDYFLVGEILNDMSHPCSGRRSESRNSSSPSNYRPAYHRRSQNYNASSFDEPPLSSTAYPRQRLDIDADLNEDINGISRSSRSNRVRTNDVSTQANNTVSDSTDPCEQLWNTSTPANNTVSDFTDPCEQLWNASTPANNTVSDSTDPCEQLWNASTPTYRNPVTETSQHTTYRSEQLEDVPAPPLEGTIVSVAEEYPSEDINNDFAPPQQRSEQLDNISAPSYHSVADNTSGTKKPSHSGSQLFAEMQVTAEDGASQTELTPVHPSVKECIEKCMQNRKDAIEKMEKNDINQNLTKVVSSSSQESIQAENLRAEAPPSGFNESRKRHAITSEIGSDVNSSFTKSTRRSFEPRPSRIPRLSQSSVLQPCFQQQSACCPPVQCCCPPVQCCCPQPQARPAVCPPNPCCRTRNFERDEDSDEFCKKFMRGRRNK